MKKVFIQSNFGSDWGSSDNKCACVWCLVSRLSLYLYFKGFRGFLPKSSLIHVVRQEEPKIFCLVVSCHKQKRSILVFWSPVKTKSFS